MTIQRLVPQGMRTPKEVMEAAVESAATASTETLKPAKTTARVENTREGVCPICSTQMQLSSANGHAVMFCADHSLVMPIRDPEPVSNPNAMWGPDTSLC